MKLSVVILNYNVHYFLQLCLSSVQSATQNIDAEILVIDNNSEDDSCQMARTLFPEVRLIENKENVGFARANNQAVAESHGEYICILNPDTVVAEDTFINLLKFAEGKTNLGIVGCKLIDGRGQFLPESKRNLPVMRIALGKQLGRSKAYYANQIGENETGKVPILVGAFMFLKRSAFDAVLGFDEDFFMYGEDIDLSYRVEQAGNSNYYFADSTVVHFKGESTLKNKKYAKRFYGAMQIFYKKHFRQDWFYDALVWIGIKLAHLIPEKQVEVSIKIDKYLLISDKDYEELEGKLKKSVNTVSSISKIEKHTEIILDANYLSYKEIIEYLSNPGLNALATFKILPRSSNFIIGSDSSKSRGDIVKF